MHTTPHSAALHGSFAGQITNPPGQTCGDCPDSVSRRLTFHCVDEATNVARAIMNGYTTDIERDTLANEDFRRGLFTGPNMQRVLMTRQPGYSPSRTRGRTVHHTNGRTTPAG